MISIAIVEDEEMYAKQLQQFLHQYEEENKEMFLCAEELKTGLENQENLAAAAKKH